MARQSDAQLRFRARLEIYFHDFRADARHPPGPPDGALRAASPSQATSTDYGLFSSLRNR